MAHPVAPRSDRGPDAPEEAYRRLDAAYQQSLRYAQDVRRLYHQLQRSICQSLLGLANALEAKDPYTRGHSERVAALGRRLAATLQLSTDDTEAIGQAGLLHDIGKIGVPEHVLRKPGALDPDEWAMMRRHPIVGAQIVSPFEFFAAGAVLIRHHHERFDGSGYPDGLCRDAIPLGARVIAVADVFDALTTDRPYRQALSAETAEHHLLEEAGRTLDAVVVAAFVELRRSGSSLR
jgi:putative nucleotidyltransferase with HDIG domain